MNHQKYAPLIGKELTWEMLKMLLEDIHRDVHAESSTRTRVKRKRPIPAKAEAEDDGA